MIPQDPYYSRGEVSNSDLHEVDSYFRPPAYVIDSEEAFRMGTLVDAMITELEKLNLYKRTIEGYTYTAEEIELAKDMRKAFFKDPFCSAFAKRCEFQAVSVRNEFPVKYGSFEFTLSGVRCKWDLLLRMIKAGGDIKSTFAETQKQFEAACEHFGYFGSRAFYMDIEGNVKDILIGISKKNLKVFKIPIHRGDKLYEKGKAEYSEKCFSYWKYFEGFKAA